MLTARLLLASVRSATGRRSVPPSRVPTAVGSYAAHASYIAVCTTASARALMVGPVLSARIAASVCSLHRSAALSVAVGPYASSG